MASEIENCEIEMNDAQMLQLLLKSNRLTSIDSSVVVYDLTKLRRNVQKLISAFPNSSQHYFAVKACPLVEILKCFVELGIGLEAASLEEVHLAIKAECPVEKVIFDSPAKTLEELHFSIVHGISISIDNEQELKRVQNLVAELKPAGSKFFLRVNPLIAVGSNPLTSVGTAASKFGLALSSNTVKLFQDNTWITGLHVHVGSQSYSMDELAQAHKKVLNYFSQFQILNYNIGGGLSVVRSYEGLNGNSQGPDFEAYAKALHEHGVFANKVISTEFGRSLLADCAVAFSRVEYTKKAGDSNIAIVHLGADFLLRKVYQPSHWHYPIRVMDSIGIPKVNTTTEPWVISGPLCFAGDLIAENIELPPIVSGDYISIQGVGAYTLGLWSHHCNRSMPLVLGYDRIDSGSFKTLLRRKNFAQIAEFWSFGG